MREIKFRAWNKISSRMDNWYNLVDKNLRNIFIMKDHNGYELMQYTGIKDRDGKEIYEGDIVEGKSYNINNDLIDINYFQVIQDIEGWKLKHKNYRKNKKIRFAKYMKVIGNIYENPELLEY